MGKCGRVYLQQQQNCIFFFVKRYIIKIKFKIVYLCILKYASSCIYFHEDNCTEYNTQIFSKKNTF